MVPPPGRDYISRGSVTLSKFRPFIAIVDDEEPVRRAIRRLMDSVGFDVETFTGGEEFLASLERRRPDCVVLDLHMPKVSGFEVQSQLNRSHHPVPVVAITGRDTEETCERALAEGASAYLKKPVDDQALLDAIAAAITETATRVE